MENSRLEERQNKGRKTKWQKKEEARFQGHSKVWNNESRLQCIFVSIVLSIFRNITAPFEDEKTNN